MSVSTYKLCIVSEQSQDETRSHRNINGDDQLCQNATLKGFASGHNKNNDKNKVVWMA